MRRFRVAEAALVQFPRRTSTPGEEMVEQYNNAARGMKWTETVNAREQTDPLTIERQETDTKDRQGGGKTSHLESSFYA